MITSASRPIPLALALAGALAALVPSVAMWGFTVDDALIPLRYAQNLASGHGYRFNVAGVVTDGVTPLPWAFLLAPLASGVDLAVALERAKVVGAIAWTAGGLGLGHHLGARSCVGDAASQKRGLAAATVALATVALAFQIGAWAVSGMETGVATALATAAAISFERPRRAAVVAGLAASLRPELVVWAMIVAAGSSIARATRHQRAAGLDMGALRAVVASIALAFLPFAACAVVRVIFFGRPTPLSVLAKPSDVSHGIVYGSAGAIVVLTPLLSAAPIALWRASPTAKTLALAGLAHLVVVVAVGGDWMPYARLMVPIAPSFALVFVELVAARSMRPVSALARAGSVLVLGTCVAMTAAPDGRHVYPDRKDLIAKARPLLQASHVVAALDVGWVGAAAPAATIIDLAGLTDPSFATLAGGHTSKNVDLPMLLDRNVDTIVVYSELRRVEARLVRTPLFADRFERVADVPLGHRGAGYAIYQRRHLSSSSP